MATALLALTACNNEEPANDDEKEDTATLVEVVRVKKAVKAGEVIPEDALELVSLRVQDVPFNPVKVIADVAGKYATVDLYVGDFVTPAKLSADKPEEDSEIGGDAEINIEYTLVTQYSSLANGNDYTAAIKKAIEENPNATIYFPDGTYEISDTIVIPANATKSVAFRLSNYATIKAVNWSDKTKPMIRMGVYAEGEDKENIGSIDHDARNVYLMGGVLDAAGIASGVVVEGSEDITLSNFTVKNAYIGVHLADPGNSTHSTSADIENVHVVGNGEAGSVGILVESTLNTLTNMRVSDVQFGMKCTDNGSNNVFRSIHAIGTGVEGTDNAGFWDLSSGNQYDICYSDQYATGFLINERARSVYNACVINWWSADNDYHVGFRTEGKLNSTISYSKVSHTHTVATDAYLIVETDGGEGFVYYPIDQTVSDKYASVLDKYCSTDILN
jgi:hypothetical protein